MGKPKKQASTASQPDPFKEQVDAVTRDYIVEPRLGEGSMSGTCHFVTLMTALQAVG